MTPTSPITVPSLLNFLLFFANANTDIKLKKLSKRGNELKNYIACATLIEIVRVKCRSEREFCIGKLFAQKIPTTRRCGGDDDGGVEV